MSLMMFNLLVQNPTPTTTRTLLASLVDFEKSEEQKIAILNILDEWKVIVQTLTEINVKLDVLEDMINNGKLSPNTRNKAALVASKVTCCMGQYDQALDFALASGNEFKLKPRTDDEFITGHDTMYINNMIKQALDTYKQQRKEKQKTSSKLDALVDRIFAMSLESHHFNSVIGLALDTRRTDMVKKAIEENTVHDKTTILAHTLDKAWKFQLDVDYKKELLDLIFQLLEQQDEMSTSQNLTVRMIAMSQCLIKLKHPEILATTLERLLVQNVPVAYQLAFDLHENAPQQFLEQLKADLSALPHEEKQEEAENDKEVSSEVKDNLMRILNGDETIKHQLQFLIMNNHTDMQILRKIRDVVRGACTHNATVVANGLMHAGTTCDDFLRENLQWISKATNWDKFNAVASLGLIHKGHEKEAKKILDPYLPKGDQDQYGFKEGGALYAYGLIHANHGNPAVFNYLSKQLTTATTNAVRHGACLALGLAALGTRNQGIYEQLRDVLYQNEAVSGEAAGIAMGLVMAGSMNVEAFNEMRQYIIDTEHEKIQRGLRTGVAMIAYGAMEEAEPWINTLESSQSNAFLRQTAVWMMAMAYVGSGNNLVTKRLLAKVTGDPNDDVKRFAAIAIGYILSGKSNTCLMFSEMLIGHFNGHTRYGAAIALAISSAGSGFEKAISLIEPLLQDKENFVRQGALIAMAILMIQHVEGSCANVVRFRKRLLEIITEKGEDTIVKFGAIIAQGILDAGGRNVTISLHNRHDQPDMPAVLGTFVFLQHWHWHSLINFLSLAFRPTSLIGLNQNLKMPKMDFLCNAKPSRFAYPPPLEEKKKEDNEKVETAVLSITKKKKGEKEKDKPMEVDEPKKEEKKDEVKKEEGQEEKEKQKELPEPSSYNLANPARVVRLQLPKLAMPRGAIYAPMRPINQGGIVIFEKINADAEEEIVEMAVAGGMTAGEADANKDKPVEPHAPFEFVFDDH